MDELLVIEGLAAQLYVSSKDGSAYVWWHSLRSDVKAEWREAAKRKLAVFGARNPHPLLTT
jgi:hypothetical protein